MRYVRRKNSVRLAGTRPRPRLAKLVKIGCELGLLVVARGDIGVGRQDLRPGLQTERADPRCGCRGLAAGLAAASSANRTQRRSCFWRSDLRACSGSRRPQQPLRAVQRAVGVVGGEGLLVAQRLRASISSET